MKPHRARQGMKILMLLFLLSLTVPVRAQLGNEGSIEGIVTDPSGAVVPGVSLKARNADTSATFSATSDASGLFRFLVLPVGTYELVADHSGFATLVQKNVVVAIGAKISLTLSLKLATGTETVVVKSETPLLESTRSQVSTTADARSVASLPLNGRNFLGFVFLMPGVAPAIVAGASGVGPSFGRQRPLPVEPGGGAGVPSEHQCLLGGARPGRGRCRQRDHKIRDQRNSRKLVLVFPRQSIECHEPDQQEPGPGKGTFPCPSVWRGCGRADSQE